MRQLYPSCVVLSFTHLINSIDKMSVVASLSLVCRQRLLIPANEWELTCFPRNATPYFHCAFCFLDTVQ